jgi:hypothetical protein
MDMDRLLAVGALLIAVAALACAWRASRGAVDVPERVDPSDVGGAPVVAFASPLCHPCQLWEAELTRAGVPFATVDVATRPDLVRKYRLRQTPLVLLLGASGRVLEAWNDAPPPGEAERLKVRIGSA